MALRLRPLPAPNLARSRFWRGRIHKTDLLGASTRIWQLRTVSVTGLSLAGGDWAIRAESAGGQREHPRPPSTDGDGTLRPRSKQI